MQMELTLRRAEEEDDEAIWAILEAIFRAGETYALPRDISKGDALSFWKGAKNHVVIAFAGNAAVGTYFLRPNASGGGEHVANCGYATHQSRRNQGIGHALCEHSIRESIREGYKAMVFNFVISSNAIALRLWLAHSFQQVGRVPLAFRKPDGECVDVLILHRDLELLSSHHE